MSTITLVLLGLGLATSAAALTIDIRTHGRRTGASSARGSGGALLAALTVIASGSLIAALAFSGLDSHARAETPLTRMITTAIALSLATIGGGPFAVLALRLATRGTTRAGVHGGILITENEQQTAELPQRHTPARLGIFRRRPTERPRNSPAPVSAGKPEQVLGSSTVEVLRGGTTIGILERIAIAGAIIAGFPEAVAVVIAIKGVGRFSELAASEAKERFIIGTLASFVWAAACALVLR